MEQAASRTYRGQPSGRPSTGVETALASSSSYRRGGRTLCRARAVDASPSAVSFVSALSSSSSSSSSSLSSSSSQDLASTPLKFSRPLAMPGSCSLSSSASSSDDVFGNEREKSCSVDRHQTSDGPLPQGLYGMSAEKPHRPRELPRPSRHRHASLEDAAAALADLSNYADYTPADADGVGFHTAVDSLCAQSAAHHLADKVASALSDAVTAVDHLKCALLILDRIVRADKSARSQHLRDEFVVAASEVANAARCAPVLARRAELMSVFGQKRFLVTRETATKAYNIVRKTEKWLKAIVKDIGRDLVVARREVRRVSSKDSLVPI